MLGCCKPASGRNAAQLRRGQVCAERWANAAPRRPSRRVMLPRRARPAKTASKPDLSSVPSLPQQDSLQRPDASDAPSQPPASSEIARQALRCQASLQGPAAPPPREEASGHASARLPSKSEQRWFARRGGRISIAGLRDITCMHTLPQRSGSLCRCCGARAAPPAGAARLAAPPRARATPAYGCRGSGRCHGRLYPTGTAGTCGGGAATGPTTVNPHAAGRIEGRHRQQEKTGS